MNKIDTQKIRNEIKKVAKDVTSSKKKSRDFLVSAGICDRNGSLKEPYK